MKQFGLKVTTVSPLAIRSDHSPTGAGVAPYIPGSTLMGCLASVHRQLRGNEEEEFVSLFLSDNVRYPNLYPASFKNKDMEGEESPIYCIPRTAQSCKRFGGFPIPRNYRKYGEDDPHGMRDSLLDWAMFKLSEKPEPAASDAEVQQVIASLEEHKHKVCTYKECKGCKECEEPLDNYHGFYRRDADNMRGVAEARTRLLTRTGINRKYGTVQDEILYNREVYEEGMSFFGVLQAEDEVAAALQGFIWAKGTAKDEHLLLDDFARLGTGRTRGFGRVEFQLIEDFGEDEQSRFEAFKQRLRSFNNAFPKRDESSCYVALTLHAPTILSDELLGYAGTISEKRFAALIGLSEAEGTVKLLHSAAGVRRVMGWQELWGLPRMYEYALEAGSVFLFDIARPLDDIAHALFTLEEQGIGQRRAEGFGRICISDQFHQERELR